MQTIEDLLGNPYFKGHVLAMNVVSHVAQNTTNRESAIDGRTTCNPGYAISLRLRKRVEEIFGLM